MVAGELWRRIVSRIGWVLTVVLCALSVSGCASVGVSAPLPIHWRAEEVFLQPKPYDRLYVEVDRVAGCELSEALLTYLADDLFRLCDKPGGVYIERSDVISRDRAMGVHHDLLAVRHMRGPPAGEAWTAYLYILFYDGRLYGEGRERPHVSTIYPAAIFVDTSFRAMRGDLVATGRQMILHEAGHILGLTKNREHSDGAHCTDSNCLMWPAISLTTLSRFFGTPALAVRKQFCRKCLDDLDTSRRSPVSRAANVVFRGPVVMRQEQGYAVGALPGFTYVHFGRVETLDVGVMQMSAEYAAASRLKRGRLRGAVGVSAESTADLYGLQRAVSRARRDPAPFVRQLAREAERRIKTP